MFCLCVCIHTVLAHLYFISDHVPSIRIICVIAESLYILYNELYNFVPFRVCSSYRVNTYDMFYGGTFIRSVNTAIMYTCTKVSNANT